MATTNYTITGSGFGIKTQFGDSFGDGGLALVQWDPGYNPAVRPLEEWTTSHLTGVWWTAWYQRDFNYTGVSQFGSNGAQFDSSGPLYLFIDFGNSNNWTTAMSGQVWMGQITDILTLPGGDVVVDLNTANIKSVVGSKVGNTLIATDWNTWQPSAVPEPSHYGAFTGAVLLLGAVLGRLRRQKAVAGKPEGSNTP